MIHNVPRDVIRMHSGNVLTVDPLDVVSQEDAPKEILELAARVQRVCGEVGDGYIVVRAYDRLDSKVAATETVVFLAHVETISRMIVQIEAPEDVTFPVRL